MPFADPHTPVTTQQIFAPSSYSPLQPSPQVTALTRQARAEWNLLRYPAAEWLPPLESPDGAPIYNVAIIGGGQSGLSAAAGLSKQRIDPLIILDRNPAGMEGPWLRFARMPTLRSGKNIAGLECGIPSLVPESWYRAMYGDEAWESLEKIPRIDWVHYLQWFRETLELPVQNETEVTRFEYHEELKLLRLDLISPQGQSHLWARRLIFANGIEGSGDWGAPEIVSKSLPRSLYATTSTDVDFESLRGKRVGVLGAGASAFDNAGMALEAGAARVDLCYRRKNLPRVNPNRWMENAGFLSHYVDLSDEWKWKFYYRFWEGNQPPPQRAYERCVRHENFYLHPSTEWTSIKEIDGSIIAQSSGKCFEFDYIIAATGLVFDLGLRPELAPYAEQIAIWSDRYTPPDELTHAGYASMPYVGKNFEFLSKQPGELPWEGRVYCFNSGANLTMGILGSAVSGLKYGLRYLVDGVGRGLYLEHIDHSFEEMLAFDLPELTAPDHV
jgi:hypothetical protein